MFDDIPDILTAKECQQLLKIGKNSMLRYLKTGEIEGFKIGSRWRIYKFSVIEFLRKRMKKEPAPVLCFSVQGRYYDPYKSPPYQNTSFPLDFLRIYSYNAFSSSLGGENPKIVFSDCKNGVSLSLVGTDETPISSNLLSSFETDR